MPCKICRRNSCTESFHSLEEQELFSQREAMPDDVELLRRMVQEGAADIVGLKEANARLISAAPDMHHALYLAIGCLKCHMFDCRREGLAAAAASAERAVNATLAAIAKAEGVK